MELYMITPGGRFTALLLLTLAVSYSHCWPTGAPTSVCASMKPGHGSVQTGASTYMVEVLGGATQYQAGTNIKVRISGGNYQGLLLQARRQGSTTVVGTFMAPAATTNTKTIACANTANSAITHSSKTDKNLVEFTWKPPAGNVGVVEFVATVAQAKTTWWMDLKSASLSYGGSATPAPNTATTVGVSALLTVVASLIARLL